jgi:hypothetical protein
MYVTGCRSAENTSTRRKPLFERTSKGGPRVSASRHTPRLHLRLPTLTHGHHHRVLRQGQGCCYCRGYLRAALVIQRVLNHQFVSHPYPRVEKFRPKVLDDVVGNSETIERLKVIARDGNCPHIIISVRYLLHGLDVSDAPGTGHARHWEDNEHTLPCPPTPRLRLQGRRARAQRIR